MAALVAAEVPEAATGLEAVVTGLTTTSKRDAFPASDLDSDPKGQPPACVNWG